MFHLNLYKEGLRRSLFLAALFISIMMLGAVLIPLGSIQSQLRGIEAGWAHGSIIVEGMGAVPTLAIAMPFFAPIATLFLFSVFNRRNSSDFYHSIPHKRETMFFSFLAALLTWVMGGIWLCTGVTLAIYAVAPAGVAIINLSSVLLTSLWVTVGCLLVIAATLLAMSITGTVFSNIVTALLIIFLPRALIASFVHTVIGNTHIVSVENFGFLGDSSYNIAVNFLIAMFDPWRMEQTLLPSILYTGVLALIYFGIALILFKKRKSETAENPAFNRVLQGAIRIAAAFLVCLPAAGALAGGEHHDSLIPFIAVYIFAVIVYFAYELIATRKLSNIKKALPGLGVLVLLNVAFVGGAVMTQEAILNRQIPAAQVASVRVHTNTWGSWGPQSFSYETIRARGILLQDAALTDMLLETLDRNITFVRGDENFWQTIWRGGTHRHTIFFETTSGSTIRRELTFSQDENQILLQLLAAHPAYQEAFLTLPENPAEIIFLGGGILSEEALREIYDTLREEVLDLDLVDWQTTARGDRQPGVYSYGRIRVQGFIGRESYSSVYAITSLTPRAAALLIQHINAQHLDGVERVLTILLGPDDDYCCFPNVFISDFGSLGHRWLDDRQNEQDLQLFVPLLLEAVRAQGETPVDTTQPYFMIQASGPCNMPDRVISATFFFHTTNETLLAALQEGYPDLTLTL